MERSDKSEPKTSNLCTCELCKARLAKRANSRHHVPQLGTLAQLNQVPSLFSHKSTISDLETSNVIMQQPIVVSGPNWGNAYTGKKFKQNRVWHLWHLREWLRNASKKCHSSRSVKRRTCFNAKTFALTIFVTSKGMVESQAWCLILNKKNLLTVDFCLSLE